MKKLIYFVLLLVGLFYLVKYLHRTGQIDKFLDNYKNPEIVPKIEYVAGQIHYVFARWDSAIYRFSRIIKNYPEIKLASESQFYIGKIYEERQDAKKNKIKAIEEYQKVIDNWPDSNSAESARKRIDIVKYGALR